MWSSFGGSLSFDLEGVEEMGEKEGVAEKQRDGFAEWVEAAALWEGRNQSRREPEVVKDTTRPDPDTTSTRCLGYDDWLLEKRVKLRAQDELWDADLDVDANVHVGDSCCFGTRTVQT
jgi:hypothetical protein